MKDNARVAGLGGGDQRDGERALRAWRWTKWVMFGFGLLTIPAFYLELAAASGRLAFAGRVTGSAHGRSGIVRHDLANHEPVKQVADRS